MTPKTGHAFPSTVLDDRTGVPAGRGTYRLAEPGEGVERLPAKRFAQIETKAREGERFMKASDWRPAYESLMSALNLIPEPLEQWNATAWLLVRIGETWARAGYYETAKKAFQDAMFSPGTLGNPSLHLRLGQVNYELGEMERAADELVRAYIGGGRETFKGQDPKYFALVESVLEPPPEQTQLE